MIDQVATLIFAIISIILLGGLAILIVITGSKLNNSAGVWGELWQKRIDGEIKTIFELEQPESRVVSVFVKVDHDIGWQCNNCEKQIDIQNTDKVKYCPFCGAQIHDWIIPKELENEKANN